MDAKMEHEKEAIAAWKVKGFGVLGLGLRDKGLGRWLVLEEQREHHGKQS